MTTNFDAQIRCPAGMEATEQKDSQMILILDDADLDAVNGGTLHDAVVRVALGALFDVSLAAYLTGEVTSQTGRCPR